MEGEMTDLKKMVIDSKEKAMELAETIFNSPYAKSKAKHSILIVALNNMYNPTELHLLDDLASAQAELFSRFILNQVPQTFIAINYDINDEHDPYGWNALSAHLNIPCIYSIAIETKPTA